MTTILNGTRYTEPQHGERVQISTSESYSDEVIERKISSAEEVVPPRIILVDYENIAPAHKRYGRPLTNEELTNERLRVVRKVRALAPTLRICCYVSSRDEVPFSALDKEISAYFFGAFKGRAERTIDQWKSARLAALERLHSAARTELYATLNTHYFAGPSAGELVPYPELKEMAQTVLPFVSGIIWWSRPDQKLPWWRISEELRNEGE